MQDGSWKPNGPLDGSGLRETTCRLLGAGAPGGATGDQGPRFASQLHPRGRPWDPEIASSVPQGLSHLFPLTGEDGPALGGPQEPPLHSPSWRGRALGLGGSWPTTCRTPPLAASAPARTTTKGRDSGSPLSFHCYGACPARNRARDRALSRSPVGTVCHTASRTPADGTLWIYGARAQGQPKACPRPHQSPEICHGQRLRAQA